MIGPRDKVKGNKRGSSQDSTRHSDPAHFSVACKILDTMEYQSCIRRLDSPLCRSTGCIQTDTVHRIGTDKNR